MRIATEIDIVKEIGQSLRDIEKLQEEFQDQQNSTRKIFSLSRGLPALLLFFSYLDKAFPEENWDQEVHKIALKIKEAIENDSIKDYSLHSGMAGICFAFDQASRNQTRYLRLTATLQNYLYRWLERDFLPCLKQKILTATPLENTLQTTLVGINAYLLYINNPFLKEVLNLLTSLFQNQLLDPVLIREMLSLYSQKRVTFTGWLEAILKMAECLKAKVKDIENDLERAEILYTLYITAETIDDVPLKCFAEESFHTIQSTESQKPEELAKLMLLTFIMAKKRGSSFFESRYLNLQKELLTFYQSNLLFGFKVSENEPLKAFNGVFIPLSILSLTTYEIEWSFPFLFEKNLQQTKFDSNQRNLYPFLKA